MIPNFNKFRTKVFPYSSLSNIDFEIDLTLKTIEKHAFSHFGITEFTLPRSVEVLERFSFARCKKLKIISLEESSALSTFGKRAFFGFPLRKIRNHLSGIETVEIPKCVDSIGIVCFSQCGNLRKVDIRETSLFLLSEKMLFGSEVSHIDISKSAEIIGENCFSDCPPLKCLVLEWYSQLRVISEFAFARTRLRKRIKRPISVDLRDCRILNEILESGLEEAIIGSVNHVVN